MINDCIAIRDRLLQTPIDNLKAIFKEKKEEWISQLFHSIIDKQWQKKLQPGQLNEYVIKVMAALPHDVCLNLLDTYLCILGIDELTVSVAELEKNREIIKKENPLLWKAVEDGEINTKICPKEAMLYQIKDAYEYQETNVIKFMLLNAPLDHRCDGNFTDLLDLVLIYGTLDEINLVIDRYQSKFGSEYLQELIEEKLCWIKRYIDMHDADGLISLFEVFRNMDIITERLVYTRGEPQSLLLKCSNVDCLRVYLHNLTKEKFPLAIQDCGGQILLNFLNEESAENLNRAITVFESFGVNLGELFQSKNKENDFNIIDNACKDRKNEHLLVLLRRMNNSSEKASNLESSVKILQGSCSGIPSRMP